MLLKVGPRSQSQGGLSADPVTLEILWTRLIAIADEAATTLVRTSFSPIVRESNDFACVVFDAAGNAIAENTIGIPSFNMTMSRTLAEFLKSRPPTHWLPGDVGICNDPWLTSGHLPDVTILAPVFSDGGLLGWTGSIAHQADIGGSIWSADTTEVFEEGLRIPPKLLFKAGESNEDLFDLIKANVRLPGHVVGDIMAQVAAGRVAAQRLVELTKEASLPDLNELSQELCLRTDAAMRRAVSNIPDGTYTSQIDLDGTDDEPIHVKVTIHVTGDHLEVDYEGTSPQVSASLNTVFNYTEAYSCYPLKCALDPMNPRNEGSYRCISVKAPRGSILNPVFPAAVNARQLVGHCLAGVIFDALAGVIGDRVIADSGSAPTLRVVVSGTNAERGRFTSILFINGGMGARPNSDGLAATCFPSNVVCGAMEVIEATSPLRIWRKQLAADTGGPGRFRGGLGQEVEVELLGAECCTLSLFVERVRHPASGLLGGHAGAPALLLKSGQAEFPLKGRSKLRPGERVVVRYAGGGGYGDPLQRDIALVERDVRDGLVLEATARQVYGWK